MQNENEPDPIELDDEPYWQQQVRESQSANDAYILFVHHKQALLEHAERTYGVVPDLQWEWNSIDEFERSWQQASPELRDAWCQTWRNPPLSRGGRYR